ncbi:hypothetical protein LRY65_05265 [Candidatus Woesebacteria bacterium]|nr:hypothetical protein [Candidatus Woesebacteria bacterium]MCD8507331.1 hypothetical protein [Candidatus Woesebacteria bacterium]MCD8527578.1 hypothetical protein [Candidatus Woesebacteria bacterium]MCD8546449.1 hypothetical protein [Candidatus Woesebacteria bacterium]
MAIRQKQQKKQTNFAQESSSATVDWQPSAAKAKKEAKKVQRTLDSAFNEAYLGQDLLRTLIAGLIALGVLALVWFTQR